MGYPKAVYDRVWETLERRRNRSREQAAARKEEATRKIPELAEIEREMARQAAEITRAVIARPSEAEEFINRLARQNLALQERRSELLRQAGFAADYLTERYTCPDCRDTGLVESRRCDCMERLLRTEAGALLSQAAPLKNCTFGNFSLDYYPELSDGTGISARARMRDVLAYCERYAGEFCVRGESLLMMGHTGLGKTHLSLAVAGVATERGYGVIYTSAQRMLDILETEKFSRGTTADDIRHTGLKAYLECDLLILDDLGTEFHTQFTGAALFNVLNSRLVEERPTIISTNLSISEIESRYTQRMVSRLICGYKVLSFVGKDIRFIKATER